MRFDPNALGREKKVAGPGRRRTGRLQQEMLSCNIGDVLDISAGGMRVLSRQNVPERIQVFLNGYQLPGKLIAELAWTKKVGLRKLEVGLRFVDVSPEVAQTLTAIAASNRFRTAI